MEIKVRFLVIVCTILAVALATLTYALYTNQINPFKEIIKKRKIIGDHYQSGPVLVTRELSGKVFFRESNSNDDQALLYHQLGKNDVTDIIDFSNDAFVADKVPLRLLGNSFYNSIYVEGYGSLYEISAFEPISAPIIEHGFISSFLTISKYEIRETGTPCVPDIIPLEYKPYHGKLNRRYPIESIGPAILVEDEKTSLTLRDWNYVKDFHYVLLPLKKEYNSTNRIPDDSIQLYYIVDLTRICEIDEARDFSFP